MKGSNYKRSTHMNLINYMSASFKAKVYSKKPSTLNVYVYLIGHSPSGLFRTDANNDKSIFK